jgi:hypothetical protein
MTKRLNDKASKGQSVKTTKRKHDEVMKCRFDETSEHQNDEINKSLSNLFGEMSACLLAKSSIIRTCFLSSRGTLKMVYFNLQFHFIFFFTFTNDFNQ